MLESRPEDALGSLVETEETEENEKTEETVQTTETVETEKKSLSDNLKARDASASKKIKDDNRMFYNAIAGDEDLCSAQFSHFFLSRDHLGLIGCLWRLPLFDGDTFNQYIWQLCI